MGKPKSAIVGILCLLVAGAVAVNASDQAIIADHIFTQHWSNVPTAIINQIVDNYEIYYVHTSHGGQINSGFGELNDLDDRFHDLNYCPSNSFILLR